MRTETWATSGIPINQEEDPLRESLEDPEKDTVDPENRTSQSQVSLKEGKIR